MLHRFSTKFTFNRFGLMHSTKIIVIWLYKWLMAIKLLSLKICYLNYFPIIYKCHHYFSLYHIDNIPPVTGSYPSKVLSRLPNPFKFLVDIDWKPQQRPRILHTKPHKIQLSSIHTRSFFTTATICSTVLCMDDFFRKNFVKIFVVCEDL